LLRDRGMEQSRHGAIKTWSNQDLERSRLERSRLAAIAAIF
jgi:hypothetical protein